MRDDEPDDSASGSPLPPEDRLWRHPSEVAASARSAERPARTPPVVRSPRRRTLVSVAVLAGVTGAAVTVSVLAATGALSPRLVERRSSTTAPLTTPTSAAVTATDVRAATTKVAAAVVSVSAQVDGAVRLASGVVVRSDGVVITSAALIEGASALSVRWGSGRTLPGRVLGTDELTGLAVLQVDADDLPVASPATQPPDPGDAAVIVGGAGPGGSSVTEGVVSAVGAHAPGAEVLHLGLIETDQPVPAKADGGALVTGDGRVAGVTLRLGSAAGWAVPVDEAVRVATDVVHTGRVQRGWLGVTGADAVAEGTASPVGVRLVTVDAGSPAAETGLAVGDVIEEADGEVVRTMADLRSLLARHRPGDDVVLTRNRAGDRRQVTVTLTDPD